MKAAVLREVPGALQIEDVEVADPGPREVRIRTAAAGLCHTDLSAMEGLIATRVPTVLGHEGAGVVEAVGEEVVSLAPGDHVITCCSVFCGQCEHCLRGQTHLCTGTRATRRADGTPRLSKGGERVLPFLELGTFGEEMLVHENAAVAVSKDIPLDRAAVMGCAVVTGIGAVFATARVRPGAHVAVIGCGGVGLNCIQGARLAGAARIIAVDVQPHKLELARTFGATDVVDARDVDPVLAVRELTRGGVDYSFEAIGLKATTEQAFAMARRGGTATVIGVMPAGTSIEVEGSELLVKTLQGSYMGSNQFKVDIPRYADLYLQGRLLLDELVQAHLHLDEIDQGFASMKEGAVARSVVTF